MDSRLELDIRSVLEFEVVDNRLIMIVHDDHCVTPVSVDEVDVLLEDFEDSEFHGLVRFLKFNPIVVAIALNILIIVVDTLLSILDNMSLLFDPKSLLHIYYERRPFIRLYFISMLDVIESLIFNTEYLGYDGFFYKVEKLSAHMSVHLLYAIRIFQAWLCLKDGEHLGLMDLKSLILIRNHLLVELGSVFFGFDDAVPTVFAVGLEENMV